MVNQSLFANRISIQFPGLYYRALEYLVVEFGISMNRIVLDALKLFRALEQAKKKHVAVFASWSPCLYRHVSGYEDVYFYRFDHYMWRELRKHVSETRSPVQSVTLYNVPDEFMGDWLGDFGESFERNSASSIRRMLGYIYFLYLEYRNEGRVEAFIAFGKEPFRVDVRSHLGLYCL
jgi:hypothetical protein